MELHPTPSTHWSFKLDLEYHFFLILHCQALKQPNKKTNKLYRDMSLFLGKKNSKQCRTHHQKKRAAFTNQLDLLHSFYNDYYRIRFLNTHHLIRQIQACLERKSAAKIISKQQQTDLETQLVDNVKQLDFDSQEQMKATEEQEDMIEKIVNNQFMDQLMEGINLDQQDSNSEGHGFSMRATSNFNEARWQL